MKQLILSLSILLIPVSASADLLDLSVPLSGPPEAAVVTVVKAHAEQLGAARADVRLVRTNTVPGGVVYHVEQVLDGLPLVGHELGVLVKSSTVVAITGRLSRVEGGVSAASLIPVSQATASLEDAVPTANVRHGHMALVVRTPGSSGKPSPVTPVWVLDTATAQPFGLWNMMVDARTGRLLYGTSAMVHAKGNAYVTNPAVSSVKQFNLKGLKQGLSGLEGEYASVSRCKYVRSGSSYTVKCDRLAKPDTKGDYIYQPDEPSIKDPFAEVQGYYHVDTIHRWMKDTFSFSRRGSDQIVVAVNFHVEQGSSTQGYQNAFYGDLDGDRKGDLVFGQTSRDFVYDADVVYHEFTHSAVNETSNLTVNIDSLGFNAQPMALNEGFADLFSCMLAGDPVVGDYMKSTGIRNLKGSASCPDSLNGESHTDGQIWGRAVWAIREQLKDTKVFDEVLYTTMATLSQTAGFDAAGALLTKLAKAEDATLGATVAAELTKRGVDKNCTRIVPLAANQSRQGYIYGTSTLRGVSKVPGPLQYKLEVPADADELTLEVRGYGSTIGAYIRKGSPVGYDFNGGLYDHVKETSASGIVLSTDDPKNKLSPGSTYYVLPLNISLNTNMYVISFFTKQKQPLPPDMGAPEPDMGAPVQPDQGVPQADTAVVNPNDPDPSLADRSGCSCSTGAAPSDAPLGLVLLALGAVAILVRRQGSVEK